MKNRVSMPGLDMERRVLATIRPTSASPERFGRAHGPAVVSLPDGGS